MYLSVSQERYLLMHKVGIYHNAFGPVATDNSQNAWGMLATMNLRIMRLAYSQQGIDPQCL